MKRVSLADSEWRLMQILWERGACTLRQLCDAVGPDTGWSKHAVISFLKRMEQKGAIAVEEGRPARHYRPLLDREEALRAETDHVLNRVYNGSPLLMVQNAVSRQPLSPEEREALIALLREGREN